MKLWGKIPLILLGIWIAGGIIFSIVSKGALAGIAIAGLSIYVLPAIGVISLVIGGIMLKKETQDRGWAVFNIIFGILLLIIPFGIINSLKDFRM